MGDGAPERVLDVTAETAPSGDGLVHVVCLPGFSVRFLRNEAREEVLRRELEAYGRWLMGHRLSALTAQTASLCAAIERGALHRVTCRETEAVTGSPVWISGNPAALFAVDRLALSNEETAARLDFAAAALEEIGRLAAGLSGAERSRKPDPSRRSIDETLTHIGNCIWWYASRLDDALAEPKDVLGEPPMHRCVRLFISVRGYLTSVAGDARTRVHVPTRYPTSDPTEAWTHAKACRREAEHAWDHLVGLRRTTIEG